MPTPPRIPPALLASTALLLAIPLIGSGVFLWLQWAALDAAWPAVTRTISAAIFALPPIGLATGIVIAWRRWGTHKYIQAHHVTQLTRAQTQIAPNATSFSYQPQALPAPALPALTDSSVADSPGLPGKVDLADLDCRPTPDHILLGVDGIGQITVAVADLCHVALLGATGGGKSNLLRLILPQLQKIGASVILADPHFAPLDPSNGDDWRPIADRLIHEPAITAAAIDQELSFMTDELARRLERRNRNEPIGPPIFFAFDELPVICDLVKDAPARMAKLLREGRKVQLLTVGASQSMLIKEIGGSSTVRDQYRTAFYVGGDRKSAAAMLDIPERDIDDGPLGEGVVLLRSKSTQPARLVRVPFVSNESLYQLLGGTRIAPTLPLSTHCQSGFGFAAMAAPRQHPDSALTAPPDSENAATGSVMPTAEAARVIALFKSGKSIGDIVRALYGPIAGAQYQKARAAIETIVRSAI